MQITKQIKTGHGSFRARFCNSIKFKCYGSQKVRIEKWGGVYFIAPSGGIFM